MALQTLHDGSTGDVVIRPGPPASGGGSGGGGGFGGNRVGASGAFGGPSSKTRKARKRAKEAHLRREAARQAEAAAQAREQARIVARNQLLAQLIQRQSINKVEIDQRYVAKTRQQGASLEQEIAAAKKHHVGESNERWHLYLISKDKNEIDDLIARKAAALAKNNAIATAFDGHDPLNLSAQDYLTRLDQFGDALQRGYQLWEDAYVAANEARLLTEQLDTLNLKSHALGALHAEQTIVWREREALWQRNRQYAEQRDARVRFKQQADEDGRLERLKQISTSLFPTTSSALFAGVLPRQGSEWMDAERLTVAVSRSVAALGPILATLTVGQAAVFMAGMTYSTELANGELSPEQRHRLFEAVAVPADALEMYDSAELQAAANAGESVEVEYRLKPVGTPDGTAIIVAGTGGHLDSRVPVINAVLDPMSGIHTAQIPGSPTRYVQFGPQVTPQATFASSTGPLITEPQVLDIPAGVDWRIQDCIVCVPGLEPVYLSFNVPPMGTGVVRGAGQLASTDWWKAASRPHGAAIPVQVGDQLRGREFRSFEAFDQALWRTLGEQSTLTNRLDAVNQKRVAQGFAPYAPKSTWVGEHREFELRYQERAEFWSDPFNLDLISIKTPNSSKGWVGIVPAVVTWPMPPANSWKPLVPPGSEHLGSTTSPIASTDPLVYPGSAVIPVLPVKETFPAVDEGEIGANIPGFPADMELPSPDALFRDRRDDPGTAFGFGKPVSGLWLAEAARRDGAPIPSQIADKLRGRVFANFHQFRRAFWTAVATDPALQVHFTEINLDRMRNGSAPYSRGIDHVGGRLAFELHHDVEVAKNGAVYGLDNLFVMTPKRHIQLHKERKNEHF